MPLETPRASRVVEELATVESEPGPITENNYRTVVELGGALFQWTLADASATDSLNVATHSGGTLGRWLRVREDIKGADLTDADATVDVTGNRLRVLPDGTLTDNRALTLGTTNAAAGDVIRIVRLDTGAFTLAIGALCTLPASERWFVDLYFDGSSWTLIGGGQLPS